MNNPFKKDSILDDEIGRIRLQMLNVETDSDEYDTLLGKFERLTKLRNEQRSKVSPDTVAIVCANLLGILIIVGYEQGHVVVSRGLQFLLKTKIQN